MPFRLSRRITHPIVVLSGLFVTEWFGIRTLSYGELTYANAGHKYPALMH